MNLLQNNIVGIIGSGAMGSGIAQVAAMAGQSVFVYDNNADNLRKSETGLKDALRKLEDKGKIEHASLIFDRFSFVDELTALKECSLIIEAIVENLEVKKSVFTKLESIVNNNCMLATNTSSLSVTAIASACKLSERVIGLHFFNPPPLMALVEVVPALQTNANIVIEAQRLMTEWKKIPVIAKDTPGFIVNRVARPFYGEAMRIYEEGFADMATIDWAMTEIGGFKMGPFALMDFIGHDVNYVVTETVFKAFYFDPRYRPSLSQKQLLDAGWLGRKAGRGFYNYDKEAIQPEPEKNQELGKIIFERILAMLINEAVEALYLNIATANDLETAMTKGVNYPKGLLQWCETWGADKCLEVLDRLFHEYHDSRYRASPLLRKYAGLTIIHYERRI